MINSRSPGLIFWLSLLSLPLGLGVGLLAGAQPVLLCLGLVAGAMVVYFWNNFEKSVLGMLILRSSLDVFSEQQLPAAFALALDGLTLLYVGAMLLGGKKVKIDRFFVLLAIWVALQGLWVILLPLGGLGFDGSFLSSAIREWVRLFSWLMVYLLVMQLKDRMAPQRVVGLLFLGLVLPLFVAFLQVTLPTSALPPMLIYGGGADGLPFEAGSRINGTLGHPNTFTTFLFLFLGLTYWKQSFAQKRLPWLILLGVLAFFFVGTKSLFGLMMLATLIACLLAPKLSLVNLIGAVAFFALIIFLFGSSEFGRERLGSIAETPLGNPDIDLWRAILLSQGDGNSFNWRLAQWTYLFKQWQQFPWFGFGLGVNKYVSANGLEPHNDYVRALVEGGVIGFTTFIGLLVAQVVHLLQLIRTSVVGSEHRAFCLTLLGISVSLAVGMITENIFTHTTLFFYWWALLAVAGWNWQKTQVSVAAPGTDNKWE